MYICNRNGLRRIRPHMEFFSRRDPGDRATATLISRVQCREPTTNMRRHRSGTGDCQTDRHRPPRETQVNSNATDADPGFRRRRVCSLDLFHHHRPIRLRPVGDVREFTQLNWCRRSNHAYPFRANPNPMVVITPALLPGRTPLSTCWHDRPHV